MNRRAAIILALVAIAAAILTLAAFPQVPLSAPLFIRHDVADDGYKRLAKNPRFDAVAMIESSGKVIGSGVLVHERWILTDAHVIKDVDLAHVSIDLGEERLGATRTVVHPDYQSAKFAEAESALARKGVDLALVQLDRRIEHVEPARRTSRDAKIGQTVTLCGFGSFGTGDDLQPKTKGGIKRAGTNVIDAVGMGEGRLAVPKLYYVCDMDSVAGDRNVTGSAEPTKFEAVGTGGDSGGGVFADVDGQWSLVGIFATARYDTAQEELQAYGTLNFITRIIEAADWIDQTLQADVK